MAATIFTDYEKIEIIKEMMNSPISYKKWCEQRGISYHTVGYWRRKFEERGLGSWEIKKHYNESDYYSGFDVDPTQVLIYGKNRKTRGHKKRMIFMYPGTEEYRWIIFTDYRVRSVVETACNLGMDVWYWEMKNNCWKRLFKCSDSDAQIIEDNSIEFKKFGIRWGKNYHWKYLEEYLIPWSEDDILRMIALSE